jgi:hypothetical protein
MTSVQSSSWFSVTKPEMPRDRAFDDRRQKEPVLQHPQNGALATNAISRNVSAEAPDLALPCGYEDVRVYGSGAHQMSSRGLSAARSGGDT